MVRVLKAGFAVTGTGATARSNANVNAWHSRYVVLTGTCISVYYDLNSMSKPLYSVVIIPESTAEAASVEGETYAGASGSSEYRVFVRDPPGSHFFMMFTSSAEQLAWIDTVRRAIRLSRFSLKAYITSVSRKGLIVKRPRKYFVLEDKIITRHRDYDKVWEIEDTFKFSFSTKTVYSDDSNTITLINRGAAEGDLELCFDEARGDYLKWKDLIAKMVTASEEVVDRIKAAIGNSLKHGNMYYRFDSHNGQADWRECNVVLTSTSLILQELDAEGATQSPLASSAASFSPAKCIEILDFSPDSACVETSESVCSFQVSNRKKLVRLRESSSHEMRTWVKAINRCVAHSAPRRRDDILSAAVRLIKDDTFYSVTFSSPGTLGFEMEARDEGWVVVGHAAPDCGVSKGSVLTSLGGKNLLMSSSSEVLQLFIDWKPPISVHFRKAPEKSGYLFEKTSGALGSKWKKRYYIMTCGQLERHDDHHSLATQVIPLLGAAVFQIKEEGEGTHRILCFRFVSGSISLLLQADSTDELLSWMASLCHGIAIANGGSYVRRVEQARVSRLARMKRKGRHHHRISTFGLMDPENMSSELISFGDEYGAQEGSPPSSIGHEHMHDEEQWWWNMGGSSGELLQMAEEARHDDNSSVGSSATHDATKEILKDTNFYASGSTSPKAAGATSVDKLASAKKSPTSDSVKKFAEQQRIQVQLNRLSGDATASREYVRKNLRHRIGQAGVSMDHAELEAAIAMAELWGVSGPEKDIAEDLVKKGQETPKTPPPRSKVVPELTLPQNHSTKSSSDSKMNLHTVSESGVCVQRAAVALGKYPAHTPCGLSYSWSPGLKSSVEASLSRGSYLFAQSLMRGRVENWKGQQDRSFRTQSEETCLPCIEGEEAGEHPDLTRVFVMDSCVQIYLNNLFIRELNENKDGVKVLLEEDTGLLVASYDEISVCDVPGHYSVILRINLHASADIGVAGKNKKNTAQVPSASSLSDSSDESPRESAKEAVKSDDPKPAVRWIGAREGDLFSNLQGVLAMYLGRCQRLQEMQSAVNGTVAPLIETFHNVADGDELEDVEFSDLHLKTAPEGRIDLEIKCASRQDRDALFLSIFYLVPPGKPKKGGEYVIPRHLSLRDRARCLPWNVSEEAAAVARAVAANDRPSSKKQAADYEETIRELKAEIAILKAQHAKELQHRDAELSKLRDRLNGQFGIL